MHVREIGSGPTVLLLHGCPSTSEMVWPIAEWLADDFHILAPDLPGYGRSPRIEPYSVESVRAELVAMLEQRDVERFSIVGHSYGAYRALDLVVHAGLEIDKMALLGGLAHYPEELHQGFRDLAASLRQGVDHADAIAQQWASPAYRSANPEFAERVRVWWRAMDPEMIALDLEAVLDGDDLRPSLEDVTMPVYLRVGSADTAALPAWSAEIADLLPDAELDVVDGAGHFIHFEDPQGTRERLVRFLS